MMYKFMFSLALVLVIAVSGCIGQSTATAQANATISSVNEMFVEKGDHVTVDYWGTLEDGTLFDSSENRTALEFDVGAGQMIKGFDDGVVGMRLNEAKTIRISSDDAYGQPDPSLFVQVSLEDLAKSNITPKAGMRLYSQGREVVITAVTNTSATIDFNHPLAGKILIFKIKMLKIIKK